MPLGRAIIAGAANFTTAFSTARPMSRTRRPGRAAAMAILLLSLTGIPPTVGFFANRNHQAVLMALALPLLSAALASSRDQQTGGRSIEISVDGGLTWWQSAVVAFDAHDSANWDRLQEVRVRAPADGSIEGQRNVVISHAISSNNPALDAALVANVEVSVVDDDTPGVLLNFYAQCGLEERLLLAFRTLKSPEQMPLVDLVEAITARA